MKKVEDVTFFNKGQQVANSEVGEILKKAARGEVASLGIEYDIDDIELIDGGGELYPLNYTLKTVRAEVTMVEETAPGEYCLYCNPLEGIAPESFIFDVAIMKGFPEYNSDMLPEA